MPEERSIGGEGSMNVNVIDVVTTKDGKIIGEREYYDQLGFVQQLGVIPTE